MAEPAARMQPAGEPFRSVESERQVLGALLHDATLLWRCGHLAEEDFTTPLHRAVWGCITARHHEGEPVDAVTVAQAIGTLDGAGVDGLLASVGSLAFEVYSVANIGAHARIVGEHARRRRMRQALRAALEGLADVTTPPDEVVTAAMGQLTGLVSARAESVDAEGLVDAGLAELAHAEENRAAGRPVLGVPTTIAALDRALGGFQAGRFYVLGGRPGTFKSALAWQAALAAAREGTPVGVLTLEMKRHELALRAFGNVYGVSPRLLAGGDPEAAAELRAALAQEPMRHWPLHVDDATETLAGVRARLMEWRHRHGIRLAVLDYLQLVEAPEAGRTRFEQFAHISRALKRLAMDLDIAVLALSQVSRSVTQERRLPTLADLRECGNIEQDADAVIFLHLAPETADEAERFQLSIAKNRSGAARQPPLALRIEKALFRVREGGP